MERLTAAQVLQMTHRLLTRRASGAAARHADESLIDHLKSV